MRLHVGQKILHFVLERKLGEGGFGEVWLAKAGMAHTALKFVSLAGADFDRGKKEYDKIRLGIERGLFNHDRLVKLSGVWLLDEKGEDIPDAVLESSVNAKTMVMKENVAEPAALLIQMELGRESLGTRLKRIRGSVRKEEKKGLEPVEELLQYIRQAAEGIDFLNTPRILSDGQPQDAIYHCDIKPENLLLMDDGKVKICDYGVMRVEGRNTRSPNALSVAHASPELYDNQPGPWSDQYSLAITYTELRTGRLPFKPDVLGGSFHTVWRAVARGDLDLDILDARERTVIKKATSLKPHKRYESSTAFAKALSKAVTGQTHVPGEDDPPEPGKSNRLVSMAIVGLAATVLVVAGGWYWFFRGGDLPVRDPYERERREWREAALDENLDPAVALEKFGELATAIDGTESRLEDADIVPLKPVLDRLFDEAMDDLDDVTLDEDQKVSLTQKLDAQRTKSAFDALDTTQATLLQNRAHLARARLALHQQWPSADAAPDAALALFAGSAESLATVRPEDLELNVNDKANLLALQTLSKWKGTGEPFVAAEIEPLINAMESVPTGEGEAPSPAERQRFQVLMDKAKTDVSAILAKDIHGLPVELQPRIENLLGADYFQLGLEQALNAYSKGAIQGAKKQLSDLKPFANTPEKTLAFDWYANMTNLEGAESSGAFEFLTRNLAAIAAWEDKVRGQQTLLTAFRRRLIGETIHDRDLALLDNALKLCEKIDAKKVKDVQELILMLRAQRFAARLVRPATEASSTLQALGDELKFLAPEKLEPLATKSGWVGTPLLELCRVEIEATEASNNSADANTRRKWCDRIKDKVLPFKDPANSKQLLVEAQLPGYLDYVKSLIRMDDRHNPEEEWTPSATRLKEKAYSEPSASAGNGAALWNISRDWAERRAEAVRILVAAARELRVADIRDLSKPPYTPQDAATAIDYLNLAAHLKSPSPPSDLPLLRVLALAGNPDTNPRVLQSLVDPLLKAEPQQEEAGAAALLAISALVHAKLHQEQAGAAAATTVSPDAKIAVQRFAQAMFFFDQWAGEEVDSRRDKLLNDRILRSANVAAAPFLVQKIDQVEKELRQPLAQIQLSSALLLARLSRAGDLKSNAGISDDDIARMFTFANSLAVEPTTEGLKAELDWFKRLSDTDAKSLTPERKERIVKILVGLPESSNENDAELHVLRGFASFVSYGIASDPKAQSDALNAAIKAYTQAIGPTKEDEANAPADYLLNRGGCYLKLAYVAHKSRALLNEAPASIANYLKAAAANAEAAINRDDCDKVKAYTLWGNSLEDLSYYRVDVDGEVEGEEKWWKNYQDAVEKLQTAQRYREGEGSGEKDKPSFDVARCKFRMNLDLKLRDPKRLEAANKGLEDAEFDARRAAAKWGDDIDLTMAENFYWLSEAQEELGKLDEADASRGQAVKVALELGDPVWQYYQLRWARLALNRLQAARDKYRSNKTPALNEAIARAREDARTRAEKIYSSAQSGVMRISRSRLGTAIEILASLDNLNAAIVRMQEEVEEKQRFEGDDPENFGVRAQLLLGVAARYKEASDQWTAANGPKSKCIAFAERVIADCRDHPEIARANEFTSRAHCILGKISELDGATAGEQALPGHLREAKAHFGDGADAILNADATAETDLAPLVENIAKYLSVFGELRKLKVETDQAIRQSEADLDGYCTKALPLLKKALPGELLYDRTTREGWEERFSKWLNRKK